mmetsp:Transcript_13029/g.18202  ORF Transcript_13029/g.18202 Transcript_13029/m.18202 type:complete len:96 (+) Transcript_13029:213-500(+)
MLTITTITTTTTTLTLDGDASLQRLRSVPESLITAELGSTFPEASGSVAWIEKAFGVKNDKIHRGVFDMGQWCYRQCFISRFIPKLRLFVFCQWQ